MPVCKPCGKYANVTYADDCPFCGKKDWLPESHYTPKDQQKPPRPQRESESFVSGLLKRLLLAIVLLGGLYAYENWLTPEKQRLAKEYNVTEDKVFVVPKPHGCDFDDAPIGSKHCHFERIEDVSRECPAPNCKVTAVYVHWQRVEE